MLNPPFSLTIEYLGESIEGDVRASVGFVSLTIEVVSRENMARILNNEGKNRHAVYILLGEVTEKQKIYIGQASKIKTRLREHERNKEWFNKIVLIYRKDHFNSAHYKYLEASLIQEAKKNKNYILENMQTPEKEELGPTGATECQQFLSYIYRVLPALRIDIFYQKEALRPLLPIEEKKEEIPVILKIEEEEREEIKEPVFIFRARKDTITARMVIREDKSGRHYIVLKESQAVLEKDFGASVGEGLRKYYKTLCDHKSLLVKEDYSSFGEDVKFLSPSTAASIIAGYSINGREAWRLKGTDISLKEWQEAKEARELLLAPKEASYKNLVFLLEVKKYGIKGKMRVENEKSFMILAGSQSRGQWQAVQGVETKKASMKKKYELLKRENILQQEGGNWIFIKDYRCSSPSLAAELIAGSVRGGWLTWQEEKTGSLLDKWRDEIKGGEKENLP